MVTAITAIRATRWAFFAASGRSYRWPNAIPTPLVEPDTFVIWATLAQHTRHLGYMASKCRSVHRNAPLRTRKVRTRRTCIKGIDLCTRIAELPMHLVSQRTQPSQKSREQIRTGWPRLQPAASLNWLRALHLELSTVRVRYAPLRLISHATAVRVKRPATQPHDRGPATLRGPPWRLNLFRRPLPQNRRPSSAHLAP